MLPILAGAALALSTTPAWLPTPRAAIERSIQHWDVSTLRTQIHQKHVKKIAFHHDGNAVEVLDINGLQRRVEIFPPMTDVLVDTCRKEHVPFSVLPDFSSDPMLVLLARSFVLTLAVIFLIDLLGMMEALIWSIAIMGYQLYVMIAQLDAALLQVEKDLRSWVNHGRSRHSEALARLFQGYSEERLELLLVRIDESDDDMKA